MWHKNNPAGLSFLALYAVSLGWNKVGATRLVSGLALAAGLGALVGPVLAGLAMDWIPHGLAFFTAAACFAFAGSSVASRKAA